MDRKGIVALAAALIIAALAITFWPRHHAASSSSAATTAPTSATPAPEVAAAMATPTPALIVEYASPAPSIAPVPATPAPAPVQATVTRDGKAISPKFFAGRSERMAVALNHTVPITLSWPNDTTSGGVFVQAVHGGKIDGHGNSKTFSFSGDKTVSFSFTPDAGTGSYEIVLRRGTTEEALSFWVPTGDPKDPPTIK